MFPKCLDCKEPREDIKKKDQASQVLFTST